MNVCIYNMILIIMSINYDCMLSVNDGDMVGQVMQKFILKQHRDLPVTGIFELYTTYSPAWREDRKRELASKYQGKGLPIDKLTEKEKRAGMKHVFEWSYDGGREIFKSLSDSDENKNFYKSKEYYISSTDNHFRIHEKVVPMPGIGYRPYLFYFAITDSWDEEFKRAKEKQIQTNNEYGGYTLILKNSIGNVNNVIKLYLDSDYLLRKYEFIDNVTGTMIGQLEIEKYYQENGKAFPSSAKHIVRRANNPEMYIERRMVAKSIRFPSAGEDLENVMKLLIPKNAHLIDDQLKQQGYVAREADIQEVLDKKVPLLNMVDTSTPLPPLPKGWPAWVWMTLGAGLAGLLLLAGWLYYRHHQRAKLTG